MYIQVSVYKFWISIKLQYHYMIIISLWRNTVYCGTSLKCEDLECILCNSTCSIWCRSKAFKIRVTVMKFCSGTWCRITCVICLQTTHIIMAGTLSEVLLFVTNNTGQQGYGNIKENSLFKLILICWFTIWIQKICTSFHKHIHSYVMCTSRYGVHSEWRHSLSSFK